MRKKKMSVVISPHLLEEMSNYVRKRGMSKFIEQALKNELKRLKKQQLIQAYRESAKEARQENQFFEGVSGDGLSQAW
ncbi:MAG: hypothetical protein JSV88_20080 [Candidatus Aminicenantes bacterium]|jgi:metal-responsive CopG/Arc/MetJ family transcriptional regulator|nr:MAG: hypothetical protein JSV88_20080 [Candidatus Aminicenantes bacterium]